MKDVTSTSFGLLIAFLLPGFAAMFTISFWSSTVHELFSKFLEAETNIGRFLLVILCSLTVGLQVSIFRWLVFEKVLCRKNKIDRAKFAHLGVEAKLVAFRAAVDEHYRYHQFWGGMAIVIPFMGWGIANLIESGTKQAGLAGLFLVVEIVTIIAACSAFKNYVDRATNILEGFEDAERMGETRQRRIARSEASTTGAAKTVSAAAKASTAATKTSESEATEEVSSPDRGEACGITEASTPEAAIGTSKSQDS